MRTAIVVLILSIAAGSAPESFAAAAPSPAVAALLDRARLWESRDRLDLAREAIDKLFRQAPDHPDGLAILAEVEIRAEQRDAARKTLDRLRKAAPDHPGIARIEALLRLGGEDRSRLREARLLAKAGKTKAALAALRALYPNGPPSGDLALEYWQLVAATGKRWKAAHAGLARLVREYPDNLHYRLALAEHETARTPNNAQALQVIVAMSRLPAFARQAHTAWRRAMMRLEPVAVSIPLLQEYLQRDPGDTAVRERLAAVAKAVEEQRRLLADPDYKARLEGLAMLERGDLDGAEERLLRSLAKRPDDAEAVGGMGLIRLRQGRHGEAESYLLRAQRLDPGDGAKWRGLAQTARFWGLLAAADEAREARDFELAEQNVKQALVLDPQQPNAVVAWARLLSDWGREEEAEEIYRQALTLAPDNRAALSGLLSLYRGQGDRDRMEQFIAGLSEAQRQALGDSLASVRAAMLREDADRLVSEGRLKDAVAALGNAIELDVSNPWLRYDLARLYARQGSAAQGKALMDDEVQKRPDDAAALYALALFQSEQNEDSSALASLERIAEKDRSESMTRLQRRLWVRVQTRRAELLVHGGQAAAANEVMEETASGAAGDRELLTTVAFSWADMGDIERARRLLDDYEAGPVKQSPTWRLRYADLLYRGGADSELTRLLDEVTASSELTSGDLERLRDLRESMALRNADALVEKGEAEAALQIVGAALADQPDRPRLLKAEARILRALKRPESAAADYRRILASDPDDNDAYCDLIDALIMAGDRSEARRLVDEWLATHGSLRTETSDAWVELTGALIDLKDYDRARQEIQAVLAVAPEQPKALSYAGQLARREGHIEDAVNYLQRSLAAEWATHLREGPVPELSRLRLEPGDASQAREAALVPEPAFSQTIERSDAGAFPGLASMLDQTTPWLSSASNWRTRSGSAGMSQLDAREVPLEWKTPWHQGGRWFLRTDLVRLSAGMLDLGTEARDFGSVLLCQSACSAGPGRQLATGMSFTTGYEQDDLRLDLGTTPLGFPVWGLVGGIRYKGDLGSSSYSVDASRRPVTSSLLSYAGTHDPRTGAVWGGVRATGLRFGLSRDEGGSFGAWSSLGLHQLSGKNVQTNDRMQLMAGGYWRVINEEDRSLSIGMTGMLWRFKNNAGEYTFGHGGYYSPQSYRSLSLPVTFGERTSRFSYTLRGSVSVSRSQTAPAPFYPTDASLQAQAEALSPVNNVDPRYTGGPGRGHGYSLAGSLEYQIQPNLFIGSRLEIERSPDFAPNRLLMYLRYGFGQTGARPVLFPPEAMIPTSEF